ncbi:ABC transporter permease, partial [Aneurinibacillus sp. UBA3580]|uniref:ABC transporter permease n=1 Tax=Aneurinibacillus sp. UBA3580 TaxID=1946041 RepID=UPI00257CE33B
MKKNKVLDFSYRYGAIFVIIAVIVFFSIVNPNFLTYDNITDILRYISIVTLVAIGVTFSLIVDGFDLSVGSTVSLTTVVTASLMVWYQMPLVLVIVIPLLLGVVIGLVNAFLIVKIRIPDLLATLSMLYIIAGAHKTYTQGFSIYNNMPMPDGTTAKGILSEAFLWIGQGRVLGIP